MRILVFIFLLTGFCSAAQNTAEGIFTVKPSFGINACQVHGDAYDGFNKAGIFTGLAVNARLSKKISLELGFYFSQKGARHNQDTEKGDFTFYRLNLNYIDLPLSFRYHLNPVYFITLGPSLAYLVSYSEENELGDWTGSYPFAKLETGVNFGLGRTIKNKFSVEVRTSNSIVPVRSYGIIANQVAFPNPVARFFNRGLYNNILTLIVSYKIDFKSKRELDK